MPKFYVHKNKDYLMNPCTHCEQAWSKLNKGQDENGKFVEFDSCKHHPCTLKDFYLAISRRSED